jgi:sugar/nucleoside kinase (ribokinase family)
MNTIEFELRESRRFDVVVIGDLNADLILQGDATPTFGQVEKLIDDATLTLGSSAAIFACGAARLGLRVGFIGKVGNDTFGQFVVRQLAERGVDTAGILCDPAIKTGLTVILSRGADRAILTYLGSIAQLGYADIDFAYLRQARHVHLASYFLLDKLRPDVPTLCQRAHEFGLSVSLDTNYDPAERWETGEALNHVDIFLPNETELGAIAQEPDLDRALATLGMQIPTIAVKLGGRGAIVQTKGQCLRVGVPPVKVVDTTGAGDTFDAGFIYGLLQGWPIEKTLQFAAMCGSLSTRAIGGTAGQPTLDEVLSAISAGAVP